MDEVGGSNPTLNYIIFSSYNFLKQSCSNINDIIIRNFTYEYNRADIALANFAQFCCGNTVHMYYDDFFRTIRRPMHFKTTTAALIL